MNIVYAYTTYEMKGSIITDSPNFDTVFDQVMRESGYGDYQCAIVGEPKVEYDEYSVYVSIAEDNNMYSGRTKIMRYTLLEIDGIYHTLPVWKLLEYPITKAE